LEKADRMWVGEGLAIAIALGAVAEAHAHCQRISHGNWRRGQNHPHI